jgi:hypothetical protein
MALTKVFYLRALDTYVSRLPSGVTLDVHVDDVTLSAVGKPREIVSNLTQARNELIRVVTELGCSIAADKTAVTGTTREVTTAITRALGVSAEVADHACLLGIDCTAGARRAKLRKTSKRAARLRAAMARKNRLKRLRATLGQRAGHIFRAGVLPAAAYDAPIWGLSDAECLSLRRLAATTLSPRARGRSLAMVLLWNGAPTADVEVAPVHQYAKMVWRAATRREESQMRSSALPDIRAMWEAASRDFTPLADRMLAARREDGTIPPAVAMGDLGAGAGPHRRGSGLAGQDRMDLCLPVRPSRRDGR